ncbi:sodium:proton symporter [Roseibium sp.]|uniref:sodium:proton symporter n=1 Tax=Roseibium sp. TaxID=1936156 RepID=UPI003A971E5C
MIAHALSALGWIGRRGTYALTASVLIGMTLPGLSALARPYLSHAVFLLLVVAFLRVDPAAVRAKVRRPAIIVLAAIWMMVVVPALVIAGLSLFGLREMDPQLLLILFLISCPPSVMSAPAFIYLMGLDGALSLALLVLVTVLAPLTAPAAAEFLLGSSAHLDSLDLALRLAGLLGGSMSVAAILRRLLGPARIVAGRSQIDGINVLVLLFFAVAAMDGVAASLIGRPGLTLFFIVLTFAAAFLQIGVTLLVFSPASRSDAFAIAHSAGNRNMGLMVAALGGSLPDLAWLWFALGQLPIYMLPMILRPFARKYCADVQTDPSKSERRISR